VGGLNGRNHAFVNCDLILEERAVLRTFIGLMKGQKNDLLERSLNLTDSPFQQHPFMTWIPRKSGLDYQVPGTDGGFRRLIQAFSPVQYGIL
jgi:hypothetical protein